MGHLTEFDRIAAADEAANKLISQLPPDLVEKLGEANLLSDLSHEFLLSSRPSQELADQIKAQILSARAGQAATPLEEEIPSS